MKCEIILIIILLSILLHNESTAQWKSTPDADNVVCSAPLSQSNPVSVTDGEDGAFVAWEDRRNDSTGQDIYVQRIDKNGYVVFQNDGIPLCTADDRQFTPALTSDKEGNAYVVWLDDRPNSTNSTDIYAQKIDKDGNKLWMENGTPVSEFSSPTPGRSDNFSVVDDGKGGIIVVWTRNYYGYSQLRAQRLNSEGNIMWDSTGTIISDGAVDNRVPRAIKDTLIGGIVFIFRGNGYSINVQRIDSTGKMLWTKPGVNVSGSSGNQGASSVIPGNISVDGGIMAVAWCADPQGTVYAQMIDTAGNKLWGEDGLKVNQVSGNHSRAKIVNDFSEDNNYYITWSDGRRVLVNNDIYAQKLDKNGVPQWTENGILVSDKKTYIPTPDIIINNNNVYVSWQDMRQGGSGLYVQKILSDSTLAWGTDAVHISKSFYPPGLIPGENGPIIVFENSVSATGPNIYAKHANSDGSLGEVTAVTDGTVFPVKFNLNQNYPNPFNPATTISWEIPEQAFISLKIYDILGKEVASLVSEEKAAGQYSILFNTAGLSSGIYFYKIIAGRFSDVRKMTILK
jgi:hypothetical protein